MTTRVILKVNDKRYWDLVTNKFRGEFSPPIVQITKDIRTWLGDNSARVMVLPPDVDIEIFQDTADPIMSRVRTMDLNTYLTIEKLQSAALDTVVQLEPVEDDEIPF